MNKNFIHVLGSADWHQTKHNDHSCYTIDHRLLIDCCPSIVTHLQECGVDPVDIPVVCFTHMHCDHFMGLAPLLQYWRVCRQGDLSGLTIVGPKANIREVVNRTLYFIFGNGIAERITAMPQVIELEGDAQLDLPQYSISVMNSDHPVPGLCYRITDKTTGHVIGLTGDTAYIASFGSFFHNVDLLVHEASYGAVPADAVNRSRHSGAHEAVRVCRESGAKRLLLTHAYEPKREAALAVAKEHLGIPVEWAVPNNDFAF